MYPVAQTSLRDLSFFVVGAIKRQKLQKFGQLFKEKHLAVLNLTFLQESCKARCRVRFNQAFILRKVKNALQQV